VFAELVTFLPAHRFHRLSSQARDRRYEPRYRQQDQVQSTSVQPRQDSWAQAGEADGFVRDGVHYQGVSVVQDTILA